jgi:2-polyprenyl-3-methyl-5-hydroxy-6-metoxy-1,4-benzoquinol methylase
MMSDEARQWDTVKALLGNGQLVLGPYFSFILRNSPRRLLHLLSYYKFAAKMIGAGKVVLDVGCSEGLGTVLLAETAASCVGVDQDPTSIATAEKTLGNERLSFRCTDILTDDSLGVFDAAVSLDVIEHIYQDHEDGYMRGIADKLAPHGILVLGTPNVTAEQYAAVHSRAGHVNMFAHDRLRTLCERFYHNVFLFSANDEMVHTGYAPMAHYLLALCVGPRPEQAKT